MVLLATIRKCQLCNRFITMKRTGQTILFPTIQSNNHEIFQNISTADNSNGTQTKEGASLPDKPPERPEIGVCCESGCQNCVWFKYVVEVRFYYEDKKQILEALNSIPDPDIKAFVEMEFKKAYRSI